MAVLATEVYKIPKCIKFVRFIKDVYIIYGLVIAPLEVHMDNSYSKNYYFTSVYGTKTDAYQWHKRQL